METERIRDKETKLKAEMLLERCRQAGVLY